jgi:hypothetical protein
MAERTITQIMPALGWGASYTEDDDELITPLVGWALVREGSGQTAVVGLVAADKGVELADEDSDFLGYVYLSDGIDQDDDDVFIEEFDDDDAFDDDEDLDDDDDDGDNGAGSPGSDSPAFGPKAGRLN